MGLTITALLFYMQANWKTEWPLDNQNEAKVVPSISRTDPCSQRLTAQKTRKQEPQNPQNAQKLRKFNQAQIEKEKRQR
jgi:hypothetical protein